MTHTLSFLTALAVALTAAVDARAEEMGKDGINLREVDKDVGDFKAPQAAMFNNLDIENKVGSQLSLTMPLVNEEGEETSMGEIIKASGDKPVFLVFGYYTCPTLCSLILNESFQSLKKSGLEVGEDFTFISVSIDERDTPETAKKKRANYAKQFTEGESKGVHFLVGQKEMTQALANSAGFRFAWDETSQQYAHAGGVFFMTSEGVLSRTLTGMSFKARDVKFALMDASKGTIGGFVDQVLITCFSYTPDSQRYGVYIFGVMRLGGLLTLLFIGGALFFLWRRYERKNRLFVMTQS